MNTIGMKRDIIIRHAMVSDCDMLSEVIEAVIVDIPYYNDIAKESEIRKYKSADLKFKVQEDKNAILVAVIENDIVGFCLSRFDDNVIWLEWFGVHKNFRGLGVSNLLLKELDKTVLIRDCHKIWCDCRTSNNGSIHILTKNGYKQIVTLKNHWYKQDFILWEKPFNV